MSETSSRKREITLINRSVSEPPNKLDCIERIAKILSLIAVPVILAIGGWWIQGALSQRNVSKDYVTLAVSILSKPQDDTDTELRAWAVDLLNANSPVPLNFSTAKKLTKGELRLPQLTLNSFQSITDLHFGDKRRMMSRSVGRLDVLHADNYGMTICTAFLVTVNYAMTTDHCIKGINGSKPKAIQLRLGYDSITDAEKSQAFDVKINPVEINSTLGYAILEVEGSPGDKFGFLLLSTSMPNEGEQLFVPHHALGKQKTFSSHPCKIVSIDGVNVEHNCDTTHGVGGAPLMRSTDLKVVAIHHSGFGGSEKKLNIGKRLDLMVRNSGTIQKEILNK